MGLLHELFFGGEKEYHETDGSTTERFSSGESITRDSDGSTREYTSHETDLPFGIVGIDMLTVTRNGDDDIINVQEG